MGQESNKTEWLSDSVGFLAAVLLVLAVLTLVPEPAGSKGEAARSVEVTLATEEPPKMEEEPKQEVEVPPDIADERKLADKTEEAKAAAPPIKELDQLKDPEAEAAALEQAKKAQVALAEARRVFDGCLQKYFNVPSGKAAGKSVQVKLEIETENRIKVEIVKSSGSAYVDDTVKASAEKAQKAGCGKFLPNDERTVEYVFR